MSQTGKFHVHTHRKNRRRRGPSGMDLQSRNASDSPDHVKVADGLGCLGCGVPTGRKNLRRRKIVNIPDSYNKWEPGLNDVMLRNKVLKYIIFPQPTQSEHCIFLSSSSHSVLFSKHILALI